MKVQKITLTDGLRHHNYCWPDTLISYPVEFETTKDYLERLSLVDDKNQEIPFQLSNIHENNEAKCFADISFITDLPSGAEKVYFLKDKESSKTKSLTNISINGNQDKKIIMHNKEFRLEINRNINNIFSKKNHIFSIINYDGITGDAYIYTNKKIDSYTVNLLDNGIVFADCEIKIHFDDTSIYLLKLRITESLEYIEMSEQASGFGDKLSKLFLEWSNFSPETRYTEHRGTEKTDLYNDNRCLPVKLVPYSSAVSWWRSKAVSFTDSQRGKSLGVFIKNTDSWKYDEYAIWGSSENHAISFYFDFDKNMDGSLTWEYPLVSGSRCTAVSIYESNKNEKSELNNYIDYLWYYYEFLNLNKVKNWVLRWEEDQSQYSRYFPEGSMPEEGSVIWHYGLRKQPFSPEFVEDMVYHLSHNMNCLFYAGPVAAREFFNWVYVIDMAIPKMTKEQFDNIKACCAFMAYAHMDENFMPINNMLAGHPNFLADTRSVPALMAALFPNHPHAARWVAQFEKAMALNLKYHVRPDIKSWDGKGGRWTENLSCYTWASLVPMMKTAKLVYNTFDDNVLAYPGLEKWADWLINALTAPVDGVRTYPPQGAHSGAFEDPIVPIFSLRLLAERLFKYRPLLAEYLLNICGPDAPGFEEPVPGADIYKYLFDKKYLNNQGTRPQLKSSKYTGYGYILRSSVGDESEISIHLQQIDEGPNYRWGRAGQGGCGAIYYNASGQRYSYNRPEDIGDENMGDVQAGCNFGVLIGHEYRSVGRNELTEPMYDFGFAQFAQINASEYSQPFYKSRSVLLSGNDYIVIYDQVGDMRVRGRFSWFVNENDSFPSIAQLKPGVRGEYVEPGRPIDMVSDLKNIAHNSKGIVFDGFGDFLTVVSHRQINCDYNTYVNKTAYGAEIKLEGRTDLVFRDGGLIRHEDEKCCFTGYAGIIRLYGKTRAEAALFKGKKIGALGYEISLEPVNDSHSSAAAVSLIIDKDGLVGKVSNAGNTSISVKLKPEIDYSKYRLYINSCAYEMIKRQNDTITFTLPEGKHTWQWTDKNPIPQETEIIKTIVSSNGVEVHWKEAHGATCYSMAISMDSGKTWTVDQQTVQGTGYTISGYENATKIHVRVRGCNSDFNGEWSHEYPVYFVNSVPEKTEGLKVLKLEKGFKIMWGHQLGVDKYKLYRRVKGENVFTNVYKGDDIEFIDYEADSKIQVYEYAVSAVNGNGEGEKSLIRDTEADGLAYWDPQPELSFRRYTKSHEYGYNGFDHWNNDLKTEVHYPDWKGED